MSDKQQTSVHFLCGKLAMKLGILQAITFYIDHQEEIREAKEMYNDEIEAATILAAVERATQNASQTSEAFAIGYSQGYTRALQLIQWQIENQLKTETK